jgi:5-methylcytosine-specific restriction endonuclease McrA
MKRSAHSAQYRAHLQSPEWARIRREALERSGYSCALCGLSKAQLQRIGRHLEAHHKHYRTLGHERPEDLTVLCAGGRGSCHALADQARRSHSRPAPRTKGKRSRRRLPRALREVRAILLGFGGLLVTFKLLALTLPT